MLRCRRKQFQAVGMKEELHAKVQWVSSAKHCSPFCSSKLFLPAAGIQEFIYSSIFLHLLLAHDSRAELHDTSSSWANAENAGDLWRESTKGGTKKGEFSKQCWNIRKCMQAWDPSDQIHRKKQYIIHIHICIYIYIQLPFSFAVLVPRSCQNLQWIKKSWGKLSSFEKSIERNSTAWLFPSYTLAFCW